MAFIMHSLSWLASNGTAAIVCFPGIMYRGGAEQKIRKYLIDNNFVDCIIQLPANLFFGTSIATCIMVLKKCKTDSKTLFIDATNECIKVTNNNKLTPENINKIVGCFAEHSEIKHFRILPIMMRSRIMTIIFRFQHMLRLKTQEKRSILSSLTLRSKR